METDVFMVCKLFFFFISEEHEMLSYQIPVNGLIACLQLFVVSTFCQH